MAPPNPLRIAQSPEGLRVLLELADDAEKSDAAPGIIQAREEAAAAAAMACDPKGIAEERWGRPYAERCLQMLEYLTGPGGHTSTVTTKLRRARALLTLGQREEGLRLTREILAANEVEDDRKASAASLLFNAGEQAEAKKFLADTAKKQGEGDKLDLLLQFQATNSNPQALLAEIDRRLQADPHNFEMLSLKVRFSIKLQQLDAALGAADAMAMAHPEKATSHQVRGFCLMAKGRHADAVEAYTRALALDPKDTMAISNKAIILGKLLGKPDEALATLDEGLRHFPLAAIG